MVGWRSEVCRKWLPSPWDPDKSFSTAIQKPWFSDIVSSGGLTVEELPKSEAGPSYRDPEVDRKVWDGRARDIGEMPMLSDEWGRLRAQIYGVWRRPLRSWKFARDSIEIISVKLAM